MTQETTIDVPKAYWWTQNKRGDWRAKYRRTSVVKRRAYLTYRSLINSGKSSRQPNGQCTSPPSSTP